MHYELNLRALEPEDADMMYQAENDEAAWIYSDYLAPLSLELLRQYALTYDADPFRSGQLRLIIDVDGSASGILDLFDISPRHLRAETGIYILPQFRGKGIATEALNAAKDYASNRLGLHQLTASISEQNQEALKTYKKAGFQITGSRPDWLRTHDGYQSINILSSIL
ncbi:MAG: GNAT family N-acetyltransferase [Muribaculaceae bacterium]|nr:GNAT family N-acetyltransferase [Muribaculaceae bacterium]